MNQITRFWLFLAVAGILCFGLMFGAYGFAMDKNPCDEDVAKFCKNIKPGAAAMLECLEVHEDKLSAACKEYEAKMGGERLKRIEMREQVRNEANIRHSCRDDVTKFCKDVNPEQDGVAKCLREHENRLSATCRESIKAADAEKIKTK